MVSTLQAMNPLIRVSVQPGPAAGLQDEAVQPYDTIVASGLGFKQTQELEERCRREWGLCRDHEWDCWVELP